MADNNEGQGSAWPEYETNDFEWMYDDKRVRPTTTPVARKRPRKDVPVVFPTRLPPRITKKGEKERIMPPKKARIPKIFPRFEPTRKPFPPEAKPVPIPAAYMSARPARVTDQFRHVFVNGKWELTNATVYNEHMAILGDAVSEFADNLREVQVMQREFMLDQLYDAGVPIDRVENFQIMYDKALEMNKSAHAAAYAPYFGKIVKDAPKPNEARAAIEGMKFEYGLLLQETRKLAEGVSVRNAVQDYNDAVQKGYEADADLHAEMLVQIAKDTSRVQRLLVKKKPGRILTAEDAVEAARRMGIEEEFRDGMMKLFGVVPKRMLFTAMGRSGASDAKTQHQVNELWERAVSESPVPMKTEPRVFGVTSQLPRGTQYSGKTLDEKRRKAPPTDDSMWMDKVELYDPDLYELMDVDLPAHREEQEEVPFEPPAEPPQERVPVQPPVVLGPDVPEEEMQELINRDQPSFWARYLGRYVQFFGDKLSEWEGLSTLAGKAEDEAWWIHFGWMMTLSFSAFSVLLQSTSNYRNVIAEEERRVREGRRAAISSDRVLVIKNLEEAYNTAVGVESSAILDMAKESAMNLGGTGTVGRLVLDQVDATHYVLDTIDGPNQQGQAFVDTANQFLRRLNSHVVLQNGVLHMYIRKSSISVAEETLRGWLLKLGGLEASVIDIRSHTKALLDSLAELAQSTPETRDPLKIVIENQLISYRIVLNNFVGREGLEGPLNNAILQNMFQLERVAELTAKGYENTLDDFAERMQSPEFLDNYVSQPANRRTIIANYAMTSRSAFEDFAANVANPIMLVNYMTRGQLTLGQRLVFMPLAFWVTKKFWPVLGTRQYLGLLGGVSGIGVIGATLFGGDVHDLMQAGVGVMSTLSGLASLVDRLMQWGLGYLSFGAEALLGERSPTMLPTVFIDTLLNDWALASVFTLWICSNTENSRAARYYLGGIYRADRWKAIATKLLRAVRMFSAKIGITREQAVDQPIVVPVTVDGVAVGTQDTAVSIASTLNALDPLALDKGKLPAGIGALHGIVTLMFSRYVVSGLRSAIGTYIQTDPTGYHLVTASGVTIVPFGKPALLATATLVALATNKSARNAVSNMATFMPMAALTTAMIGSAYLMPMITNSLIQNIPVIGPALGATLSTAQVALQIAAVDPGALGFAALAAQYVFYVGGITGTNYLVSKVFDVAGNVMAQRAAGNAAAHAEAMQGQAEIAEPETAGIWNTVANWFTTPGKVGEAQPLDFLLATRLNGRFDVDIDTSGDGFARLFFPVTYLTEAEKRETEILRRLHKASMLPVFDEIDHEDSVLEQEAIKEDDIRYIAALGKSKIMDHYPLPDTDNTTCMQYFTTVEAGFPMELSEMVLEGRAVPRLMYVIDMKAAGGLQCDCFGRDEDDDEEAEEAETGSLETMHDVLQLAIDLSVAWTAFSRETTKLGALPDATSVVKKTYDVVKRFYPSSEADEFRTLMKKRVSDMRSGTSIDRTTDELYAFFRKTDAPDKNLALKNLLQNEMSIALDVCAAVDSIESTRLLDENSASIAKFVLCNIIKNYS